MTNKDNERYYKYSMLYDLAYNDAVNGDCNGKIDITVVDSISGADVAPVVHGEWIPIVSHFHGKPDGRYYCSVCHRVETMKGIYCRLCGALMDGGNKI